MSKETETVIPIIPMHKSVAVVIMALVCLVGVSTIQPVEANPQFIISSWTYPDQYGQGITLFRFYENSTGSWVEFSSPIGYQYDNTSTVQCPSDVGIKIRCTTHLNSTLLGISGILNGLPYIRHNISVSSGGAVIFEQQNFTLFGWGQIGPIYSYNMDVIFDFLPQQGAAYYITIIYEVFY